jgi:hypothetical protein
MSQMEHECDAEQNVICCKCLGLVEMNCGCPPELFKAQFCQCDEPKRSDVIWQDPDVTESA